MGMNSVERFITSKRFSKISTIILSLVVVVISTSEVEGYSYSIYDQIGIPVVVLILLLYISVLARVLLTNDEIQPTLFMVLGVYLAFPLLLGYFFYGRADPLTHIGYTKEILVTGEFHSYLIYPVLHVITAAVSIVSQLEIWKSALFLSYVVSLLSVLFMTVALRSFHTNYSQLFGSLLAFGGYVRFTPFHFSILIFPLAIYSLHKSAKKFNVIFVVVSLLIIISHPIAAAVLLLYTLIYTIFTPDHNRKASAIVCLSIISTFLVYWYLSYELSILNPIIAALSGIFGAGESGQLNSYTSTVSQDSPSIIDIITVGTIRYGPLLGIIGIAILVASLYFAFGRSRDNSVASMSLLSQYMISLALLTMAIITLFQNLIVGFDRYLIFSAMISTVLIHRVLNRIQDRGINKFKSVKIIVAILIVISTVAFVSTYDSSLDREPNRQLLKQEYVGDKFVIQHHSEGKLYQFGTNINRVLDSVRQIRSSEIPTQDPTRQFLRGNCTPGQKLLYTKSGKRYYSSMFPDYRARWKFSASDFNRFESNENVVYSNGFVKYAICALDKT